VAPGLLLLSAVSAACSGGPIDFSANQSLTITTPSPLAVVSLPLEAAWHVTGSSHDRYAVFVDRTPIAPGAQLRALAGTSCKHHAHCPSASFLAGLGVYVTSSQGVSIPSLPDLGGTNGDEPQPVHTLTVVLVNSAGRRIGASSWQTEFRG
jgi:hypothetical protein